MNALDHALRKALVKFYPQIDEVQLLDYKVRVLGGGEGTAALVRVLIESGDGHERWGTVGVSPNVIEASWQALVRQLRLQALQGPQAAARASAPRAPAADTPGVSARGADRQTDADLLRPQRQHAAAAGGAGRRCCRTCASAYGNASSVHRLGRAGARARSRRRARTWRR